MSIHFQTFRKLRLIEILKKNVENKNDKKEAQARFEGSLFRRNVAAT